MPDPLSWIYWIVVFILVLIGGFFSGAETAFNCINVFKMKVKAEEGNKTAALVVKIHEKYDRTLISVLISYNIVQIILSSIATVLFVGIFKSAFSGKLENETIESIATISNTIIMTIITYIFSDTIPKLIARAAPEKTASICAYPIYFFNIILFPVSILFEGIVFLFKKLIRVDDVPTMTEEDFTNVVEQVEESGTLDENESDIIQATLDFTETDVKSIFTPISKVFAINKSQLKEENIKQIVLSSNYSRIPVYEGDINNIIGVLHVKSYLEAKIKNPNLKARKVLQQPFFVNQKLTMNKMLDGFKKEHTHIAFVLNSHKKVIGIVTMDDVLEELVGNISFPSGVPNKKGNN